ncbi:MAG TPA: cyclic nucleotide-binding domain-containing protein [Spirochaetota bacterium]|nr:cyclic nucleotide-binding domain-containing protein [Spirochaetota bacterium]
MSENKVFKVYDANDVAVSALLLRRGELFFTIGEKHSFSLRGENIIFGVAEVLFGLEHNTLDTRMISVHAREGSDITKIPNANLKKFITLYNIGFNITRVIARAVQKSNDVIGQLNDRFIKENNLSKRHYITYYNMIKVMGAEAKRRGHPRLEAFIKLKEQSLAYRKGKLFTQSRKEIQSIEGRRIDEFKTEFPKDAVICKQNDPAEDLFVLNRGQIRVMLGSEEVALIDKPGTIFGEMSLFLNDPRSATLVAASDTLVTVIGKESLQAVSSRMPDFFMRISTTLWTRFKTNMEMIRELEQVKPDRARKELVNLQKEIEELMRSERIFWLREYSEEIQNAL